MKQYKVLKHLTEGTAASQQHNIALTANSGVTDSNAALALGECQEKTGGSVLGSLVRRGADLEQEAGDTVIKSDFQKS